MASPDKHEGVPRQIFDRTLIGAIAKRLVAVHDGFPAARFSRRASRNLDALALRARSAQIADSLAACLPSDPEIAFQILLRAMGEPPPPDDKAMSQGFAYLPFLDYVERHGLDRPELALPVLGDMTRHFSAEFAIRPFLQQHAELAFASMHRWADDNDWRRRRLASEGTRPRLPWGQRLKDVIDDPAPVITLLDKLYLDDEAIVRRSVANNLNDIAKDHPALAVKTASRWLAQADANTPPLVRHAMRSLVKAGHPEALAILGYSGGDNVTVKDYSLNPGTPKIGSKSVLSFTLVSDETECTRLVIDYAFERVLANGKRGRKVFKLSTATIAPGEHLTLAKPHDFSQRSTRTHHPGNHSFTVLINGREAAKLDFFLEASAP